MSLSLEFTKKVVFLLCKITKMKIETLVLTFFLETLLFSVEIRGGGQISTQMRGYCVLYNNQINARTLIGQSAIVYCTGKPMEKSCVLRIII